MAGHGRGRGGTAAQPRAKLPRKPAPTGRRGDSAPLIGDPGWYERDALSAPPAARRHMIPMPRGGARWLVDCPRCSRRVKSLYSPADSSSGPSGDWRCRHCWHLRYRSQYSGRRPACDPERMMALLDAAVRAERRGNHELAHRRADRFFAAMDSYEERMAAYQIAEMEQGMADLQRQLARIDRQERAWKRKHHDE